MLQISARHLDKTTILDVSGDIDLASTPEFRKAALRELRELRTPRVLLNLTAVRYIDSSGVASLVEALKEHHSPRLSRTDRTRSEEHTSELQSRLHLVCRLLLEKKKKSPIPTLYLT